MSTVDNTNMLKGANQVLTHLLVADLALHINKGHELKRTSRQKTTSQSKSVISVWGKRLESPTGLIFSQGIQKPKSLEKCSRLFYLTWS